MMCYIQGTGRRRGRVKERRGGREGGDREGEGKEEVKNEQIHVLIVPRLSPIACIFTY